MTAKKRCRLFSSTIFLFCMIELTRLIREGWPLSTVETVANGDSRSKQQKVPSLVGSLGSSYKRFFSCLGCIVQIHCPVFHFVCPPWPNKLGRQSCQVACLVVNVSGINLLAFFYVFPLKKSPSQYNNIQFVKYTSYLHTQMFCPTYMVN